MIELFVCEKNTLDYLEFLHFRRRISNRRLLCVIISIIPVSLAILMLRLLTTAVMEDVFLFFLDLGCFLWRLHRRFLRILMIFLSFFECRTWLFLFIRIIKFTLIYRSLLIDITSISWTKIISIILWTSSSSRFLCYWFISVRFIFLS